jgi:ferredoxin-NADP reductase
MVGAAVQRRLSWVVAEIVEIIDESPRVRSLVLMSPGWDGHLPGQHIDIRLTAEDGYQAQRSYSIATPEDDDLLTITVELIETGEVSPYLVKDIQVGDQVEIRGPIGGYFVWESALGGPVQLIGGGSGVVPLMAMLRARARSRSDIPFRYFSSARSHEDLLFQNELDAIGSVGGVSVSHTLTRSHPDGWRGLTRRVDRAMLEEYAWPPHDDPLVYICGPTGFVESVATSLVEIGHRAARIRTERFGPTGR